VDVQVFGIGDQSRVSDLLWGADDTRETLTRPGVWFPGGILRLSLLNNGLVAGEPWGVVDEEETYPGLWGAEETPDSLMRAGVRAPGREDAKCAML
jgi:hypothetical protein